MSQLDDRQVTAGQPTAGPGHRPVHFVGSLPPAVAPTDRDAMQWILNCAGDAELTTLPCDRDPQWIIDWLNGLRHRDPLETVLDGDCADYRSLPAYRVSRGGSLEPADVALRRSDEVASALAARRQLSTTNLPPYQVSMPAPWDLALFAFGVPAASMRLMNPRAALRAVVSTLRFLPVFTTAVADEIARVLDLARRWDDDVVIQLESPAVMVAYDRAPRAAWSLLTRILSQQTANTITAAPADARFVVHAWCHGDLGNKPIATLSDLTPAVDYANALATRLTDAGRELPPLHLALCDGATSPSADAADYAALSRLRPDIRVIAGLVDERHPGASARALELTEAALDRPVSGIAAACGLGRRTEHQAIANAALAAHLATTATTSPTVGMVSQSSASSHA